MNPIQEFFKVKGLRQILFAEFFVDVSPNINQYCNLTFKLPVSKLNPITNAIAYDPFGFTCFK